MLIDRIPNVCDIQNLLMLTFVKIIKKYFISLFNLFAMAASSTELLSWDSALTRCTVLWGWANCINYNLCTKF